MSMRRFAIFFFFDEQGVVDDYICFFLNALKKNQVDILFVVNGEITRQSRKKVEPYVNEVLCRENKGFDVWAYKDGIEYIGYEKLKQYDELIMLNHTNFGPIYPLEEVFIEMDKRSELGFWGLTKSFGNGSNIPQHIQSHFIAVRNKVLRSPGFQAYWEERPEILSFQDALYKHEFVFTPYFEALGFKWDVYLDISAFEGNISNPLLVYPLYCVKEKRVPIIKRKSFFLEDNWLYGTHLLGNLPVLMRYLKNETDYDIELIWQNVLRTQSMRTLVKCMGLYHVSSWQCMPPAQGQAAVVLELCHLEHLDGIREYLKRIPSDVDLFFCMDQQLLSEVGAKQFIKAYPHAKKIEKENHLPAVWQEIPRLCQYTAVAYVNNRQIVSELTDTFRAYDRQNFENMLYRKEMIWDSVNEFIANNRLGMMVSGVERQEIVFFYKWHEWYATFHEFCQAEGVCVRDSVWEVPSFSQTDFCWVRGNALRFLWKHTKALEKAGLSEMLCRCFAVEVLQNNGFYTAYQVSPDMVPALLNVADYNEERWMMQDYNRNDQQGTDTESGALTRFKAYIKSRCVKHPWLKKTYNHVKTCLRKGG